MSKVRTESLFVQRFLIGVSLTFIAFFLSFTVLLLFYPSF